MVEKDPVNIVNSHAYISPQLSKTKAIDKGGMLENDSEDHSE